jgi:hypothetical protein
VIEKEINLPFKDIRLIYNLDFLLIPASMIKKEESKRFGLLDTIKVTTGTNEEVECNIGITNVSLQYLFSNFFKSSKVYTLLEHLWQQVLKKRLNLAQSTSETINHLDQDQVLPVISSA